MKELLKDVFDESIGAGCLVVILILALVLALCALEAWVVMLLWNAVACAIFASLPTINFWMAWGLMILCGLLFRSHSVSTKSE
jgi:hypothetical protein